MPVAGSSASVSLGNAVISVTTREATTVEGSSGVQGRPVQIHVLKMVSPSKSAGVAPPMSSSTTPPSTDASVTTAAVVEKSPGTVCSDVHAKNNSDSAAGTTLSNVTNAGHVTTTLSGHVGKSSMDTRTENPTGATSLHKVASSDSGSSNNTETPSMSGQGLGTASPTPVTLSLSESARCAPEEEELLNRLDEMDVNVPAGAEDNDRDMVQLTVEVAQCAGQGTRVMREEAVSLTDSSAVAAQPVQSSSMDVVSAQPVVAPATTKTVVTVSNSHVIDSVAKFIGFNPISPDSVDVVHSLENSEAVPQSAKDSPEVGEKTQTATNVNPVVGAVNKQREEEPRIAGRGQGVLQDEGDGRPNSRGAAPCPGGFVPLELHADGGRRSRPNSRGAAPSPLTCHPRESPNIFVSIRDNIPAAGQFSSLPTLYCNPEICCAAELPALTDSCAFGILFCAEDGTESPSRWSVWGFNILGGILTLPSRMIGSGSLVTVRTHIFSKTQVS